MCDEVMQKERQRTDQHNMARPGISIERYVKKKTKTDSPEARSRKHVQASNVTSKQRCPDLCALHPWPLPLRASSLTEP